MGVLEVVLMCAGAIIFIISFLIPVNKEELHEDTRKLAEAEIRGMVENETRRLQESMSSMAQEKTEEQLESTKRAMERISNEKIMAVNEYSDTVLDEIHKNHQEVVFLYEMLTDKQKSLKETISDADKNVKDLLQQVKDSEITVKENLANHNDSSAETASSGGDDMFRGTAKSTAPKTRKKTTPVEEKADVPETEPVEFKPFKPEVVEAKPKAPAKKKTAAAEKPLAKSEVVPSTPGTKSRTKKAIDAKDISELFGGDAKDLSLEFTGRRGNASSKEGNRNSNERILELHKEGKSNMAIAKELGLGIGEVKLVIDLYEGMR